LGEAGSLNLNPMVWGNHLRGSVEQVVGGQLAAIDM
jgi:hypothetical protein